MKRATGLIAAGLILMLIGCASENPSGKDTVTLVQDADLAYTQGNWARAESQYRLIVQRVPGDAYAWFKLGNLYMRTDRPNEAMYAYQQTLARDNTYAKAYHNLALLYLLQGQRTLEAGIKAALPNDPQLAANRALLAQLTTLVDGPPADQQMNSRVINRAAPQLAVPTVLALTPAHTSQPVAASPATVDATLPAQAEPDPVIIDVDAAGQSHRLPAAQTAGGTRMRVLPRSLTLREAPHPTAAPVLGLNRGDIVIAVDAGSESGWRQVSCDGQTGWVYARYLREITPALPSAPMSHGKP